MPAIFPRSRAARAATAGFGAGLLLALAATTAHSQPAAPATAMAATGQPTEVDNSALDAQLFYQLLVGEIELRGGSPGAGFEIVLDAARKQRSEQLFKRATDIALQARAGEQALTAARAWREALPKSAQAHRYVIQLLVALGKSAETVEPLRSLIEMTPLAERPLLINSLPRFFANSPDKKTPPALLEAALKGFDTDAATQAAALQALASAWLIAQEPQTALELTRRAQALDPKAQIPVMIALQMLPTLPAAESIVTKFLETAARKRQCARLVCTRAQFDATLRRRDHAARAGHAHRARPRLGLADTRRTSAGDSPGQRSNHFTGKISGARHVSQTRSR